MFFYYATGITPAMIDPKPGTGSTYAITLHDESGAFLDGGKTYEMHLPPNLPVEIRAVTEPGQTSPKHPA